MRIAQTKLGNRQVWIMDNGTISLAMTVGGGNIASLVHRKRPRLNPLWKPVWKTIEPWQYRPKDAARYGVPLLASICGHNLCLGWFGPPSAAEAKAGMGVHGEAPVVRWKAVGRRLGNDALSLTCACELPGAQMRFTRTLSTGPESEIVDVCESVQSLSRRDMPFTMCEHVTFGPPFLEKGVTLFDMPATECRTFPGRFEDPQRLAQDAAFRWPDGPGAAGGPVDMRTIGAETAASGDFSAQLIDPARDDAWFSAVHPGKGLLVAYVWKRSDFPWVGNWEENCSRKGKPWAGKSLTRGMEFTNTPFPSGLRAAVEMHAFQGQPTYRWLPAGEAVEIRYRILVRPVEAGCRGVREIRAEGAGLSLEWR